MAKVEVDSTTPPTPAAKTDVAASRVGARILIVEDNATNRKVLMRMLDRFGVEYNTAEDGLEAVERASEERFALILMDLQMPNMDGVSATKAIRSANTGSLNVDTPIIAVSANATPDSREFFLAAGMNDCCPKPISLGALREIVDRWLGKG